MFPIFLAGLVLRSGRAIIGRSTRGDIMQGGGAALGIKPTPFALRRAGLLNGVVEGGGVAIGNSAHWLQACRINHVDGVAAVDVDVIIAGKDLPGEGVEIRHSYYLVCRR